MNRRSDVVEGACEAPAVDAGAVRRVVAAQPDAGSLHLSAALFSALGEPTRLRILFALSREPLCVCDLAVVAGVSASAVSHQLRILRDRRLVSYERDGKRAIYRLADRHVRALLSQGLEHVEEGS